MSDAKKAARLAADAEKQIVCALNDLRRGDRVDAIDALSMAITNLRSSFAASAGAPPQATAIPAFQFRVGAWMEKCFGERIALDKTERNYRFLEEALELVQACALSAADAHKLVDYVYGRPVGEPEQECGGVMVTLAALCNAHWMDMDKHGETELTRVNVPAVMRRIRAKQAAKKIRSPLPGEA